VKGRRLGRGLEALLGREEGGYEPGSYEGAELIQVAVDQVDPNPYQPRRQFDPAEIASLADSLRQHGMLQPILIRASGLRYQLIAGERRLRASVEAQLHEVPARVLNLDDQRVYELAMVENLQREDLNAIDKARAFRDYLSRYGGTQEELAGRLGIDRSTVSNLIRLLDLPEEILDAVRSNQITQGHARALLGLEETEAQIVTYRRVQSEHLSVRQTEALVSTGVPTPSRTRVRKDPAHGAEVRPPHLVDFEQALHHQLGTTVAVRARTAEKGQIIIDYRSLEEFDRLAGFFRLEPPLHAAIPGGPEQASLEGPG
jgi:ParB family transcriptional regulator, chromosome partitioning protein